MLRKIDKSSAISYQLSAKTAFLSSIISGILLSLSFNNGNLWLLAWFSFVFLFFALENKTKTKVFLFAYLSGFVFWWATIYWLANVTFLGTAILIFYLALYFGIFGLVFYYSILSPYYLLLIPSSWVLLEYIRSYLFTGFPWALLGYSQYLNLPVIQIADIAGVWGVSFLVMMGNVMVYSIISRQLSAASRQPKGLKNKLAIYILPCFLFFISLGYGYYKLTPGSSQLTAHNSQRITVIQANIPQELKWDPRARNFIIDKYLNLSYEAASNGQGLIIWPEAALPVIPEEDPQYLDKAKAFAVRTQTTLLLGAVTKRGGLYYNSALYISPDGNLEDSYDKVHLVPFGEYIPLKKTFPFLETIVPIGDVARGESYVVFPYNKTAFSVLICFEDLFPELSRRFIGNGADFLVNITNDAWYKKTTAPFQHLQASVFRAVENRAFLIRAANTGVSGFIQPNGKIISLVRDSGGESIFVEGSDTQSLEIFKPKKSFYCRFGDISIVILFIFSFYAIILFQKNKR